MFKPIRRANPKYLQRISSFFAVITQNIYKIMPHFAVITQIFTMFLRLKLYLDDEGMVLEASVQWHHTVLSWFEPGTTTDVIRRGVNHSAIQPTKPNDLVREKLYKLISIFSTQIYSILSNDSVNGQRMPDQTARMRSLIGPALSAYTPKTHFLAKMARF